MSSLSRSHTRVREDSNGLQGPARAEMRWRPELPAAVPRRRRPHKAPARAQRGTAMERRIALVADSSGRPQIVRPPAMEAAKGREPVAGVGALAPVRVKGPQHPRLAALKVGSAGEEGGEGVGLAVGWPQSRAWLAWTRRQPCQPSRRLLWSMSSERLAAGASLQGRRRRPCAAGGGGAGPHSWIPASTAMPARFPCQSPSAGRA